MAGLVHVLHFVAGIFGNATALFLFLAPLITFKRIVAKKSTEQFSGLPYVMTMLNCLLSAWYGMPFVSPDNLLVSTINGTGTVIEFIYVIVFLVFAPKKGKKKIGALLALALSVFAVIALVSILALHGNIRKLFCGVAATIFSIAMYGSPLSIIRVVIKTKSVEFMPFFLSLFVFLCGTSWFIFGLLGKDPFVAIKNGLNANDTLNLVCFSHFVYNCQIKQDTERIWVWVRSGAADLVRHLLRPEETNHQNASIPGEGSGNHWQTRRRRHEDDEGAKPVNKRGGFRLRLN